MSDDLVAKLNRLAGAKDWGTGYGVELTLRAAADEIERLRAALAPTDQQEARRIAVDLLEGYGPETMVGVVCRALLER